MPPTQTNLKVMSVKEIPFLNLQSDKATEAMEIAIKRVLKSGSFVLGSEVEEFEQEFAAASGLAQAVGVGNGTDALSLILKGLNIGPGGPIFGPRPKYLSRGPINWAHAQLIGPRPN